MALLLVLVPALVGVGARALSRDNGGKSSGSAVSDPAAPGYEAVVTPTDTLLVMMSGPDGGLSGMAMMSAAGGGDGGGTVLLIPSQLEVGGDSPRPRALADIALSDGFEGASQALAAELAIGFGATVVLDEPAWVTALQPLGSLNFANPDDLVVDSSVVFAGGDLELEPSEVAAYLGHSNADEEDERARLFRQELAWQAWLNRVADAASVEVAVGGSGELARFMGLLVGGGIEVIGLPVETVRAVGSADSARFRPAPDAGQLIADAIPFPAGSRPGERIGVKVLDGTGDRNRALEVAVALVPHGAEILVIGNAERFDVARTEVRYRDTGAREAAVQVAELVGAAETTQDPSLAGGSVAVTVIVGADVSLNTSTTRIVPTTEPQLRPATRTIDTLDGLTEPCGDGPGCDE